MSIERALIGTTDAAAVAANYIEDVFSTYLYTGTGAAQTINNGIDLSTKGGMVWIKKRNAVQSNGLLDTLRGNTKYLMSNATDGQYDSGSNYISSFGNTGYTLGAGSFNTSADTYASWTFRKQAKFFDIVTYTGTGSARTIGHSLGATPGMIIVKRTDTTSDWQVYHNGLTSAAYSIQLNLTNAQASATTVWNSTAPTSSVFSVGTHADVNASGGTYVAYLYAASNSGGFGPAGTDSVVACGSVADTAGTTVNLGWEPQFILTKTTARPGYWFIFDNMRGMSYTQHKGLAAQTSGAEISYGADPFDVLPNGFKWNYSNWNDNVAGETMIYMAIRRGPMKTPTDATKVFSPVLSSPSGSGTATIGFPLDMMMRNYRYGDPPNNTYVHDRLRGVSSTDTPLYLSLHTSSSAAEDSGSGSTVKVTNTGFDFANTGSIHYSFRRAPGFFDVVCYTGTGSTNQRIVHNLGVAPELIIAKNRVTSSSGGWYAYAAPLGTSKFIQINTTGASVAAALFSSPSSTDFGLDTSGGSGVGAYSAVAYLFATCPGVSKVGSYTGTGAAQNIDCGFAAGARFVLIKCSSATGSWWVFDTARGISSSGNDPGLQLNSTSAESASDFLNAYSGGFGLNSATLNDSGQTFIYLAIA